MASNPSLMEYVVEQMGPGASCRAMFGEYGVYLRGAIIGLFCDDRLFLKRTEAAAALLGPHDLDAPYPGAKPAIVVPEERWDDRELMAALAAATAAELAARSPPRKPRAPKQATKQPAKQATKQATRQTAKPQGKPAAAQRSGRAGEARPRRASSRSTRRSR